MTDYVAAAKNAAPAFGFGDPGIEVLHESENVVCKVTTPDDQFVMRLHRPGYNTRAELDSEVLWVQALEAARIPVPTAVSALNGDYYIPLEINGEITQVGVVEWIAGVPLRELYGQPATSRSLVADYARIGALSASVRHCSESWEAPPGFVRRRWDTDAFLGETPAWGRFWDVEQLTSSQRDLFVRARSLLTAELSDMATTSSHFGLIHADLHLGNVMANGDDLTIIDFDDAGYSWYAYDLAVALHPVLNEDVYAPAREAIVDGYRSVCPFTVDQEASIDTFLTLRSLIDVSWLDEREALQTGDKMAEHIALAVERAALYVEATG